MRNRYLQQMGITPWVLRRQQTHINPLSKIHCPALLTQLQQEVAQCARCSLHQSRTQTVFASGNPQARCMIVGEAPGFHEDHQGLPLVGKAGSLLNKMLYSIGLSRDDVYIANVLKCRPPHDRDPQAAEIQHCQDFLQQQIQLVNPALILGLGYFAGQFLSNSTYSLGELRQQVFTYQGIPALISYHPAHLLHHPLDKKKAYEDLKKVKQSLVSRQR